MATAGPRLTTEQACQQVPADGRHDDHLYGGHDNDHLRGGPGHDFMRGGSGDDS